MNMEAIAIVIIIAVIVEAVIQVVKAGVPETVTAPAWVWPVCSAALGIVLCVLAGVDALALLGVELSIPAVGSVLTGILVSRGASFVHDLWGKINEVKTID